MFDLNIRKPEALYSRIVEVSERVVLESCTESGRKNVQMTSPAHSSSAVGITGETVQIIEPLGVLCFPVICFCILT